MRSGPEPDGIRREQEFYLVGLIHSGVHEIEALCQRWCMVYPAHCEGGRDKFDALVRDVVLAGKAVATVTNERVTHLRPPAPKERG